MKDEPVQQITIYTKTECPNCVTAKEILKSKGLAYTERNLDDPVERLAFINANPDIRQMPQIYLGEQRLGGLAGLRLAVEKGML